MHASLLQEMCFAIKYCRDNKVSYFVQFMQISMVGRFINKSNCIIIIGKHIGGLAIGVISFWKQ